MAKKRVHEIAKAKGITSKELLAALKAAGVPAVFAHGAALLVATLLGGSLAAVAGLAVGLPSLRLRGDYLAIVTLGFGEIVPVVARNWEGLTNGAQGLGGIRTPRLFGFDFGFSPYPYYFLGLGLVAAAVWTSIRLQESRVGRAWMAIREDELAAGAMGVNHVALQVGDIEEALAFYGRLFDFKLRGKSKTSAFIDLGDQFLALQKGRTQAADDGRHFGLVVDNKDAVRRALAAAGIKPLPGPFLDFRDPWGNRIEIVGYDNIQFTKAANVLRGMGLAHLSKNRNAIKELKDKGMSP